jgi:predicted RNase H-like HicB family nuclease
MVFDLYLESGPQHRKTWVFVPSLAGCSTTGPTSEAAVELARGAIADRLDFLRRHGEPVPDEKIEVVVADHVIERKVLGFAQQSFAPDREPPTPSELSRQLRWAQWSREEFVAALRAQSRPLALKPASGRSAAAIITHVAESEWAYVSAFLDGLHGRSAAIAAIEEAGEEPWEALAAERAPLMERMATMTPEEMSRLIEKGGKLRWSARRMLRRLLEHEWEHVMELRARLPAEGPVRPG